MLRSEISDFGKGATCLRSGPTNMAQHSAATTLIRIQARSAALIRTMQAAPATGVPQLNRSACSDQSRLAIRFSVNFAAAATEASYSTLLHELTHWTAPVASL